MNENPCGHVAEIADAIARHDFPGLPSIAELDDDIRAAYEEIATDALLRVPDVGEPVPANPNVVT